MKKRYRAAAALALIVLQLFCFLVPASAADETAGTEGEWVAESFSNTKITADFQKTEAELNALYPKTAEDKASVELISAVTQLDTSGNIYLYFYFYSSGGLSGLSSGCNVTIRDASGGNTQVLTLTTRDKTETILKMKAQISSANYAKYKSGDGYEFFVSSFALSWRSGRTTEKITYDAITRQLDGGSLSSEILLTVDPDGSLTSWVIKEEFELDVHLSASRYSKANTTTIYNQLNTAMFLLPKQFFNDWKNIVEIVYQYRLFERVPMLVTECERDDLIAEGEFFNFYEPEDLFKFQVAEGAYTFGRWSKQDAMKDVFMFFVDEIKNGDLGVPELTNDECIARYQRALSLYDTYCETVNGPPISLGSFLAAENEVPLSVYKRGPDDFVTSDSYADSLTGFEKFLSNLFGIKYEDDSVNVPAIQTADQSHLKMTDEEIKKTYAIGDNGLAQFKELLSGTNAADYTLVIFHFKETEYFVSAASAWHEHDQFLIFEDWEIFPEETYYCENAIIDDFKIIEINMGDKENIHMIPIAMETMTFIEAPQSPDLLNPIVLPNFGNWWKKIKSGMGNLLTVLRVIVFVVIVVAVVWLVLKLVGVVKSIFDGSRGRGG